MTKSRKAALDKSGAALHHAIMSRPQQLRVKEQDERIRRLLVEGKPITEIASAMNMTRQNVSIRIKKITGTRLRDLRSSGAIPISPWSPYETAEEYLIFAMLKKKRAQVYSHNRQHPDKAITFSLSVSDLLPLPTTCPILGIPLSYHRKDAHQNNGASLDRINPKGGYTKENTRIISARANRLKGNATKDELFAIINYINNNT